MSGEAHIDAARAKTYRRWAPEHRSWVSHPALDDECEVTWEPVDLGDESGEMYRYTFRDDGEVLCVVDAGRRGGVGGAWLIEDNRKDEHAFKAQD